MIDTNYVFPFGQLVKTVKQKDQTPKKVFVLGVHGSAIHARWIDEEANTLTPALPVASEPYPFWRGEDAEAPVAQISLPAGLGRLLPAGKNVNGTPGRALDDFYLKPLGLSRNDV